MRPKFHLFFSKLTSVLVLLLAMSSFAMAQKTVTGVVTDRESGDPLIAASVVVKGTTNGVSTGLDGEYSIDVEDESAVLVFSYIGYSDVEETVGDRTQINVTLSEGEDLSEVVVVGYGTVKKRDVTGSVTSIASKDFNQGVISSPEQLLQGRAPGVQVTTNSGEPGGGVNIRIRGTSSVRSGNNPLFVVDGVPLSGGNVSSGGRDVGAGTSGARNPLNFLNPSDIASIDILKDASATAIYGSRGANGVVIITTKSGSGGGSGLSYSGSISLSNITQKYDILSAQQYRTEVAAAGGDISALDEGSSTDWQDEIFRSAITHNHDLSFGSGNAESNYRVSLSYQNQQGIVEDSGLRRYTGRISANHKMLNDRVTLGANFTVGSVADINSLITDNAGFEGDLLGAALSTNPTRPIFDSNGDFVQPGNDQRNPRAILAFTEDNTTTTRVLGSVSAGVNIVDGLDYKLNIGVDRTESVRRSAFSENLNFDEIRGRGGRAFILNDYNYSYLIEHTLNYTKEVNDHSFGALVGFSYQEFDQRFDGILAQRFRVDDPLLMLNNLSSADADNNGDAFRAESGRTIDELQSYFGRVNYGYQGKYLLTATVRADGSSKFGENNRYGIFPSFAVAWRIVEEGFLPDAFSDLKLRAGWGVNGNQEFSGGNQIDRQRFINGNAGPVGNANPDLKWEETSQVNVGLDFGFNNGRLRGTFDFYRKVTSDLLIRVDQAQPAIDPFVFTNLDANVINQGVELSLNYNIVNTNDFSFDVAYNIAYNSNKVDGPSIGLINTGEINGQGLTGAFAQRIADGQPLYSYYLRDWQGFDSEGFNIYVDENGNEIESVFFVGKDPLPDVTMGLTTNFAYKNFDLSLFFNGVFGAWIYNNTANALFTQGALGNGRNVITDAANVGESNINAPDASTRFLENGDFVRLANLNAGYSFDLPDNEYISSFRVFFSGQNLLTFTGYSGQDPEVNVNKSINDVPSLGIDYTPYPRARVFTLGITTTFK